MTQEKLETKIEKSWIDKPENHKKVNYGLLGTFAAHAASRLLRGGHPFKRWSGTTFMTLSAVHLYQKRKTIKKYITNLFETYKKPEEHECDCDGNCGDDCTCDGGCKGNYD
ncbi:hypothetical protein COV93_04860 [Candidatus Woesearchaeota archaeon CG11_big_fil_rev_8_21_14_0_20_43_8]|nr:MAG: hypothetical protein COV93_04860 [Candidatus Woesearchaeota archaeon CG11_big_fil_rev_8_21_14_0_20_43_8]PIO07564.1 MAG: hypothetical protein COT47_01355 [Candidatus Woesearchaeota archaeon CG08_land_8_20_14_0_20_43_7]